MIFVDGSAVHLIPVPFYTAHCRPVLFKYRLGFGYQPVPGKNLLGVGFNWGRPNESTFAPGLDDQYTVELFYRWNVTREIALTPDLQYLKNPALNPGHDSLWVLGLRARLAL